MKIPKMALSIVATLLLAGSLSAGTVSGTIKNIQTQSANTANGVVSLLEMDGSYNGTAPNCAGGLSTRFAFDPSTNLGKTYLTILLAAVVSGQNVVIYGSGVCDAGTGFELISLTRIVK